MITPRGVRYTRGVVQPEEREGKTSAEQFEANFTHKLIGNFSFSVRMGSVCVIFSGCEFLDEFFPL